MTEFLRAFGISLFLIGSFLASFLFFLLSLDLLDKERHLALVVLSWVGAVVSLSAFLGMMATVSA